MKRFITATVGTAMFFLGVGVVVESATATYKSDEKALEIIRKARTAIGGDAAIAEFKSLVIKGQTSTTFSVDGSDRIEQGETEIAMQMPDKLIKSVKIGKGEGTGELQKVEAVDIVIARGEGEPAPGEAKKIVVRKMDGGEHAGEAKVFVRKADGEKGNVEIVEDVQEIKTEDGKKFTIVRKGDGPEAGLPRKEGNVIIDRKIGPGHEGVRQNEMLRTTLALLLTAPLGMDVEYTYGGDSSIDGTAVSLVTASFGGSSFKMYFDRSSYLPVAMSYSGHPAPMMFKITKKDGEPNVKSDADVVKFERKIAGPAEGVERLVRFADYRTVNGVQLPYKWTTSVGGKVAEVFDVTAYDVNPSDIGERFKGEKVMVRTKKPAGQN